MYKKRSLLVFAVMMSLLLSIAGCATAETATTTATTAAQETAAETTAAATTVTTAAETSTAAETTPAANDLTLPYKGPTVTWTCSFPDLNRKFYVDSVSAKVFYEKYAGDIKINYELYPFGDMETKTSLYFASGDVPDLMLVTDGNTKAKKFGAQGLLLDLSKYSQYMPNLQKYAAKYSYWNYPLDDNGSRFYTANYSSKSWMRIGWFYNETLLNKLKIPVPTTFDELLKAIRDVKAADSSTNPLVSPSMKLNDILGYCGTSLFEGGSNANRLGFNNDSKQWFYGPIDTSQILQKEVAFINTLWNEKLVPPDSNTMSNEQCISMVQSGKWAFYFGYFEEFDTFFTSKDIKVDWTAKAMVPPGEKGIGYSDILTNNFSVPYWCTVYGAKVEKPELLAQFLDLGLNEDAMNLYNWGVEGITYKVNADGTKQFLPVLKTFSNPGGENNQEFYGMQRLPLFMTFNDNAASKPFYYGDLSYSYEKFNLDAVKANKIIPLYSQPSPSLTDDERNEISNIMNTMQTYFDEQIMKFMLGERNMSEWDAFITELKGMGDIGKVLSIYNSKPQLEFDEASRNLFD